MELKLDLHIHSARSHDGCMALPEIIAAAKAKGLSGVAICDHDRLLPPQKVSDDFIVIRGEEFSTEYGHLLGLFLTEEIEPGSFSELVGAIHRQGGLAVLAHPFERHGDVGKIAPILPLLDGLEVWNGRANRKRKSANAEAAALAKQRALPCFAGSDAHVAREIGNGYVAIEVETPDLLSIKSALLQQNNPVFGTNGRHYDVARSQRTKLNKTGAGLKQRLKWAAFAVKCWLEDLKKE